MAGLDALKGVLDREQLRDLEEDFVRFRERTGSDDRDLFVQYLAQQGLLSHEQLLAALRVRGRPETTELDALVSRFDDTREGSQRTFAAMSPEGTYALLALVGEGSMGRVHIGKDHDLKRKVAYKEISEALSRDPGLLRRFLHEVQITAQLDHPSVIPVYGLEASQDGRIGYAMKLVEGRTLGELIATARERAREGKAPEQAEAIGARLEHFLKVCDAIAYAHARGVIHRDLKPENVMVGRFGEVYVMDWGLARLLDRREERLQGAGGRHVLATQIGHAVGTPAYMSPEQAQGRNDALGPASDQYALGLILQELLTLRTAVDGPDSATVLQRAARGERNPMRHVAGARIPPELQAIVQKACAKRPQDRYGSVAELGEDVRRYVRGRAPLAYREGVLGQASRALLRYREAVLAALLLSVVGGASVTVLGLVGLQWQQWSVQRRDERLGEALAQVSGQAHRIDAELQRYERLLEAAASSAVMVLTETEPEVGVVPYLADALHEPGRRPPDLATAPRFGEVEVSFEHPVFKLAPGLDPLVADDRIRRLIRLRHAFKRLLLRTVLDGSLAVEANQVRRVLGEGNVPVSWMYVGTADGVHVGYPGHGGYPDSFDPRKRPWYTLSADKRGIHWGNPYRDVNGLGVSLPASTALYDAEGRFLGVAGIDLTFDYLIETMLVSPLEGARESYLLDDRGRVVVRSDAELVSDGTEDNEVLALEPFDVLAVREAIRQRRSGHVVEDGELLVFYRLHAQGWYYVVRGPENELLGG